MTSLRRLRERSNELHAIDLRLSQAESSRGGVLIVEGPTGVGKSSLLAAARENAGQRGITVLRAHGSEMERDFAFGVVRQLLEPAVRESAGDELFVGGASPALALFDDPPAAGQRLPATGFGMIHALYWLVVNLCDSGPLAMLVDDAHWADAPSLSFLAYLGRRAEDLPLALIIAAQEDAPRLSQAPLRELTGDQAFSVIRPASLTRDATLAYVRWRLNDADDQFGTACYDLTAGNPLYLHELIGAVEAAGLAPIEDSVTTLRRLVPPVLGGLLQRRIARLDPDTAHVLRCAATLGNSFETRVLRTLAGVDAVTGDRSLDELVRLYIFRPTGHGQLAFRAPVMRSVVDASLSPVERSRLHARAADILNERGAPVEQVAAHVMLTEPDGLPGRIEVLRRAAEESRRRGAPSSAARYLSRALREPPAVEVRSQVVRELGVCEAYAQHFAEAEASLREASACAVSPAQRALADFSLGRFLNSIGRASDAAMVLERAVDALPRDEQPLHARLLAALVGSARLNLHSRDLIERRLPQLIEEAPQVEVAWPHCQDFLDANRAFESAVGAGDPAQIAHQASSALAAGRLRPDQSAYWLAIHALCVADATTAAATELDRGLIDAQRRGMTLTLPLLQAYRGRVALMAGDLGLASGYLEEGLSSAPPHHFALPLLAALLAEAWLDQGDVDGARATLEDADVSELRPETAFALPVAAARGRILLAEGASAEAAEEFLLYGELCRHWGAERLLDTPWRSGAARALHALGDEPKARSLAEEELHLAREFGAARPLGIALREYGALLGATDGERYLDEARAVLERSTSRLELARTLLAHGQMLVRARRRPEGRAILRDAIEVGSACGARALVQDAATWLRSGGGPPPRIAASGVTALTPAQRRVAELAARGLTNREIAQTLFVTEKTVEAHLGRAFSKLGIRSRWQLAERLGGQLTADP